MTRTVALTGATSFIGRVLVNALRARGDLSLRLLCRSQPAPGTFAADADVRLFPGLEDVAGLRQQLRGADVVIHLAGLVSFRQRDRDALLAVNRQGTLNVLRACEEVGVGKFFHVSSTAALGFGRAVLTEESRFDWSRYPRCVYARSKSSPEEVILSSAATAAIIYPALVLGAGDEKNTLPLLRAVKRGRMRLSPPGSNSGIDVRDLARGISWFIDRDVPGKRVILAGYHFTFRELQTTIAEVLQVAPPWGTMPRALGLPIRWLACGAERLMDQPPLTYEQAFFAFQHRRHDTSRMRALGFQPRYSLRDTITEAARDFSARGLL